MKEALTKCPNCIGEPLVRQMANILVCQSCDIRFVETMLPSEPLRPIYDHSDPGDENDFGGGND